MRTPLRLILCCLALVSISAQAQPAQDLQSAGTHAVHALAQHVVLIAKNPVPKTGQQLTTTGHWLIGNETPPACSNVPAGSGACLRVIYAVPEAAVSCEWVVLLNTDGSDVTFLDENDDAAHYFLVKLSAAAAKPLVLNKREPVYPPIAGAAHVQGDVKVEILIRANGRTSMGEATGPPMLTGASTDAARDWDFKPLQIGNRTVPYQTEIVFHFTSSGLITGLVTSTP